jgi:hypothetical protein
MSIPSKLAARSMRMGMVAQLWPCIQTLASIAASADGGKRQLRKCGAGEEGRRRQFRREMKWEAEGMGPSDSHVILRSVKKAAV